MTTFETLYRLPSGINSCQFHKLDLPVLLQQKLNALEQVGAYYAFSDANGIVKYYPTGDIELLIRFDGSPTWVTDHLMVSEGYELKLSVVNTQLDKNIRYVLDHMAEFNSAMARYEAAKAKRPGLAKAIQTDRGVAVHYEWWALLKEGR